MYSGDKEEDPPVNATALTSTSRTFVLSETLHTADETSPPQQDIGHPTPVGSPRAPSPKKVRIELGKESSLLTGSSATPPMDDVRTLTILLFVVEPFSDVDLPLHVIFQPLMKEFIRLGTQFIGYRDYADKLKGIPLLPFLLEWIFLCYFAVTLPSFILLNPFLRPISAPTTLPSSWSKVKKLVKRLSRMLPLSRVFEKDSMTRKMP
jgi:hypothetical protein